MVGNGEKGMKITKTHQMFRSMVSVRCVTLLCRLFPRYVLIRLSVADDKEAEAHVNACLDSGTSHRPRKPTPPPKDTTPKPITSISHRLPSPSPPPPATSKPNAFSVLMSSHKEKEVWKETESEERRDGRRSGPRKAPFYKVS